MWKAVSAVVCAIVVAVVVPAKSRQHWVTLLTLGRHSHSLDFPPNELSALDVSLLLWLLVWKALKTKIGLQSGLAAVVRSSKHQDGRADQPRAPSLPGYTLTMPLRVQPSDACKYLTALNGTSSFANGGTGADGFRARAASVLKNPALVSLFLSAVSEPAFLVLLAQADCPIQPLGAVNVRNRFELLDYNAAQQLIENCFQKALSKSSIIIRAYFQPETRVVKRGIEIDIVVSIVKTQHSRSPVEIEIFKQIFTVLEFVRWPKDVASPISTATEARSGSSDTKKSSLLASADTESADGVSWDISITSDDPGLWAALCLDYNPIHHLKLAARVAGFAGRLAHGNHVAARAISATGCHTVRHEAPESSLQPYTMEISFKKPVVVPSALQVVSKVGETFVDRTASFEGAAHFDVKNRGRTCVEIILQDGSTH